MRKELDELREKIDVVDDEIARLLNERMRHVKKISRVKTAEGLPTLDSERERMIVERVKGRVDEEHAEFAERVFRVILDASKECQNRPGN